MRVAYLLVLMLSEGFNQIGVETAYGSRAQYPLVPPVVFQEGIRAIGLFCSLPSTTTISTIPLRHACQLPLTPTLCSRVRPGATG